MRIIRSVMVIALIGIAIKPVLAESLDTILAQDLTDLNDDDWQVFQENVSTFSDQELFFALIPEARFRNFTNKPNRATSSHQIGQRLADISLEHYQGWKSFSLGSDGMSRTLRQTLIDDLWGGWQKVAIEGAQCSDGSPYKIFIMPGQQRPEKDNLLIYLEPGGGCWDYQSCAGSAGGWGAANPHGISDRYMDLTAFLDQNTKGGSIMPLISPVLTRWHPSGYSLPTSNWTKVFFPYCTGDAHSGNRIATYTNPLDPSKSIKFHHLGAANISKALTYLKASFHHPAKLVVAGVSAGAIGALGNYARFRQALEPDHSFLVSDGGMIFSATEGSGPQYALQKVLRSRWNLDDLIDQSANQWPESAQRIREDLGAWIFELAKLFPQDHFAISMFKQDLIFSHYSYGMIAGWDPKLPKVQQDLYRLLGQDLRVLTAKFATYSNLHYFIPFMRPFLDSHCATVASFTGSRIQGSQNIGQFISQMLDGHPLASIAEPPNLTDQYETDPLLWLMEAIRKHTSLGQ